MGHADRPGSAGTSLIGRTALVADAVEAVQNGESVMLVGPPGVGRSRVLASIAARLEVESLRVEQIAGVSGGRALLFAPFAHLLNRSSPSSEVELLARFRRLFDDVGGRSVLIADDAHLLDPGSVVLLRQLIAGGATSVVVAVSSGEPIPESLAALGRDSTVRWTQVERLDRSASDQLAEALVEGVLPAARKDELWRLCRGNPFVLVEVLGQALDRGVLDAGVGGRSDPERPLGPTPRLLDAFRRWVEDLGAAGELVRAVALCGGLPEHLAVRLVGSGALRRCLDSGLLCRSVDSAHRVELAYGFAADACPEWIDDSERARLTRWLIDHPPQFDATDRTELVGYGEFLVATGEGSPAPLERAAAACLVGLDGDRALRFAEAAISRGGGATARLLRARALHLVGRRVEAAMVFVELSVTGEPRHRAMAVAHHAAMLLENDGNPDAAIALIEEAVRVIPAPHSEPLHIQLVNLRFCAGDPRGALAEVQDLLDARGPVPDAAIAGVVNAYAALGRPEVVSHYVASASRAAGRNSRAPLGVVDEFHLAWGRIVAHWQMGSLGSLASGDFDDPPAPLDATPPSRAEGSSGPVTLGELLAALLWWQQGRSAATREVFDAAIRRLDQLPGMLVPFVCAGYATVESSLGELDTARDALTLIDRHGAVACRGLAWWVERARIQLLAVDGRISEAVEASAELAARHRDQPFVATTTLHDAVRFGRGRRVAAALAEQAARPGATWWDDACASHALAGEDPKRLLEVADTFATGGRLLEAAEAAAQAAAAAESTECRVAAHRRLEEWSLVVGRPATPAFRDTPQYLTEREFVVARMAASGLTNAEIAAALGTSVRTVGNQLQSVYQKLGVNSRSLLAPLIG